MTFTPATEKILQDIWSRYPEGRKRSAVIPMLVYAQYELGQVSQ